MIEIAAFFYDGKTSQRQEVRISFHPSGLLRITGLERDLVLSLSEVRISPRIGNTPRSIYLPGDAKCETLDNDAIDAVLEFHGRSGWHRFLHKLESRLGWALAALVITIVGAWGLVQFGIPALAKQVAFALPESVDAALGQDGLKVLDRLVFSPSDLQEDVQDQFLTIFDGMTQELTDARDMRLEFRKSDLVGPNAFALPSGVIVVTDELVLLAEHEKELIAVLAHEIGHVMHRHTLRRLLQNSAAVLVIANITGDITSLTALSAGMPTLLLETKYSRVFETEADEFAMEYMRAHDIPLEYFARILLRMEEATGYGSSTHNYLASHPATSDRVKMFQGDK